MPITYQQHEAHARAVRQGHDGRTSRGLSVEIARFALDNPIFGDDPAELLADLQRCAADCIGAGCEPRVRPLPGQPSAGVARLAAVAQADQVEDTPSGVVHGYLLAGKKEEVSQGAAEPVSEARRSGALGRPSC